MFGLMKKISIGLLSSIVSDFNHTKYVSLSNQKCMIQPTLINLPPNNCSQEFRYYPFLLKLDRRVGSSNTPNDLSNKVCVPNKIEDLNISVFNIITAINESKTSTKDISCECKCKFDGKICNSRQWCNIDNVDVSVQNILYVKMIIFGILLHVIVKWKIFTKCHG